MKLPHHVECGRWLWHRAAPVMRLPQRRAHSAPQGQLRLALLQPCQHELIPFHGQFLVLTLAAPQPAHHCYSRSRSASRYQEASRLAAGHGGCRLVQATHLTEEQMRCPVDFRALGVIGQQVQPDHSPWRLQAPSLPASC